MWPRGRKYGSTHSAERHQQHPQRRTQVLAHARGNVRSSVMETTEHTSYENLVTMCQRKIRCPHRTSQGAGNIPYLSNACTTRLQKRIRYCAVTPDFQTLMRLMQIRSDTRPARYRLCHLRFRELRQVGGVGAVLHEGAIGEEFKQA